MATPRSERGGGSDDGGGGPGLGFGLGMEGWSARDDDRRINVYMTCGKPLVWTPEEQEILRRRYNVVCHPIGTLANHSSQNIFKGVPYMIDEEAVRLLIEFDKVQLWRGDDLAPFLPSDIASLQRHRLDSVILQLDHMLYGQKGRDPKLHAPPRTKRAKQGSGADACHRRADDDDDDDDEEEEEGHGENEDADEEEEGEGGTGDDNDDADGKQQTKHGEYRSHGNARESSGEANSDAIGSAARTVVSWVLNRIDVERWLKFPWTRRGKALAVRDIGTVKALDPDKEQPTQADLDKGDTPVSSTLGAADGGRGGCGSRQASTRSSANRKRAAGEQEKVTRRESLAEEESHEEDAGDEEKPKPTLVWCNVRRDIGQRLGACRVVVPHQAPGIRHRRRPFLTRSFKFPATKEEKQRYAVYRDLVLRGYFLTPGLKFGGHYLVYPGDPYRYHSHFVAVVVDHHHPLHPLDFVAAGRLGTVVKKAPLMCSVDENQGVHYVSLQWTGIN